ncbi:Hypothetical_protein [Hexamita inflata]|nr:Hypothetical protein HINF_LOCUS16787 [Hexamita inflata]
MHNQLNELNGYIQSNYTQLSNQTNISIGQLQNQLIIQIQTLETLMTQNIQSLNSSIINNELANQKSFTKLDLYLSDNISVINSKFKFQENVFDSRINGNVSNLINIIKFNSTNLEGEINQAKQDTFNQLNSIIQSLRQDVNAKAYSADVYNKDFINAQLNDLSFRIAQVQASSVYMQIYPGAVKYDCQTCGKHETECNCQYKNGYVVCNAQGCTPMIS